MVLTYFVVILWISLFSSSFNLWRIDSRREKWKLIYWATWKTHKHTQDKAGHLCERFWARRRRSQVEGDGMHTSLLISSVFLSMRKMRAFSLEGPWRSRCSSGMSVFFSRLLSAKENKNQLQSRIHVREERRKIIWPLTFFFFFLAHFERCEKNPHLCPPQNTTTTTKNKPRYNRRHLVKIIKLKLKPLNGLKMDFFLLLSFRVWLREFSLAFG